MDVRRFVLAAHVYPVQRPSRTQGTFQCVEFGHGVWCQESGLDARAAICLPILSEAKYRHADCLIFSKHHGPVTNCLALVVPGTIAGT
jgi:hypothetical protein